MTRRRFKRLLHALQKEGYLKRNNPMKHEILRTIKGLAFKESSPEWVNAFLESAPVSRNEASYASVEDGKAIFMLLGREPSRDSSAKVLAQWLLLGLSAKSTAVACACDVSVSYAARVRRDWEEDLRSTLADAACIGLSGEDLYNVVTQPDSFPAHLIQRLTEFRTKREEAPMGPTSTEMQQMLEAAWFDYRVDAGRQGAAPDDFEVWFVPKWFRNKLL
jgi:hypothetical protein